ncbi:hypothetical protein QTP86_030811 [Hemibagrus guttatus]|nr:hypothetical protein QTP86_030811 [Hemibagrus guttatus]
MACFKYCARNIVNSLPLSLSLSVGSKVMVEFTNGLPELGSPVSVGPLQVLQLAEELRLALELQGREGRDTLRSQLPCSTAQTLLEWLDKGVR